MKLKAEGDKVYTEDGQFMFSIPLTQWQKMRLDSAGRRPNESWLQFRKRTEERSKEEYEKRCEMALDIAMSYNYYIIDRARADLENAKHDFNVWDISKI